MDHRWMRSISKVELVTVVLGEIVTKRSRIDLSHCKRHTVTEHGLLCWPVAKTRLRLRGRVLLIRGGNWCFVGKLGERDKGCDLSRGRAVPEAFPPVYYTFSLCVCMHMCRLATWGLRSGLFTTLAPMCFSLEIFWESFPWELL